MTTTLCGFARGIADILGNVAGDPDGKGTVEQLHLKQDVALAPVDLLDEALKAFKAAACDADLSALDKALRRIFAGKPADMSHLLRQHILHAVAVAADEPHKGGRAEFVHSFKELIDITAFEEYVAREKYGLAAADLFACLPLFLEVVPEIHGFFGYENTPGCLRMIRQHRLLQKPLNIVLLPCLNL